MSHNHTQQYAPAQQRWDTLAIVGFVLSFFIALPGLIVSILGLRSTKTKGTKGRGLAIAGIIISALGMIGGILVALSQFASM